MSGGHLYDFLICYECHSVRIYKDDVEVFILGILGSTKVLDSLLLKGKPAVNGSASSPKK